MLKLPSIHMITLLFYAATASTMSATATLFEGDPCKHTSYVGKCVKSSECKNLEGYLDQKILTIQEVPHCTYSVFEEILCCPLVAAGSEVPSVTPESEHSNPFHVQPQFGVDRGDTQTDDTPFALSDIFQTNVDFVNAVQNEMTQGDGTTFGAKTMTKNSRSISSGERNDNAAADSTIGLDASSGQHGLGFKPVTTDLSKRLPLLPLLKETDGGQGDFREQPNSHGIRTSQEKAYAQGVTGSHGSSYVHGSVGSYGNRRFNGSSFAHRGVYQVEKSVGVPGSGYAPVAEGSSGNRHVYGSGGSSGNEKVRESGGLYSIGRLFGGGTSYGTGNLYGSGRFYGNGRVYGSPETYSPGNKPGSGGFHASGRPLRGGETYGTGNLYSNKGFYASERPLGGGESYGTGNIHGSAGLSSIGRPFGGGTTYGPGNMHGSGGFNQSGRAYVGGEPYGTGNIRGSGGFYGIGRPFGGGTTYGIGNIHGSGGFHSIGRPFGGGEPYGPGNIYGSGGFYGSGRPFGGGQSYNTGNIHGSGGMNGSLRTHEEEEKTSGNKNVFVTESQSYSVTQSGGSFGSESSQLRNNRSSNSQTMLDERTDTVLSNIFEIFNTKHEYIETRGEIDNVKSEQQIRGANNATKPTAMDTLRIPPGRDIHYPIEKNEQNVNDSCTSKKYAGVCTTVSDCERVNELILSKKLVQEDITTCSLGLFEEIICCPLTDIIPRISDEETTNTIVPTTTALSSVIQRTTSTDIWRKHSYIAAIGYPDENYQETEFRCTGILIHPKFVLVSSNCIREDFTYYTPQYVRFGLMNPHDYDEEPVDVNFKKWHMTNGGIAIIELAEEIPVSEAIAPACLHSDIEQPFPTENLHITHFGLNAAGIIDCDLHTTNVTTTSIDKCMDHYVNNTYVDKATKAHICLAALSHKSDRSAASSDDCRQCLNAAGSALSYLKSDGSSCVFGIATPTNGCDTDGPVLYTNIAYFKNFLQDFLEDSTSKESATILHY